MRKRSKKNEKTQIQSLKKYLDEMNAKCSFKHLTNKKFYHDQVSFKHISRFSQGIAQKRK